MVASPDDTEDLISTESPVRSRRPGVLVVFSDGRPLLHAIPLDDGRAILGRDPDIGITDRRVSRCHAQVVREGREWRVADRGSRNGTFVNGRRVHASSPGDPPRVIRLGYTIYLLVDEIDRYLAARVAVADGWVVGPVLEGAFARVRRAASDGQSVLISGESGTGKELAARAFHSAGGGGPFLSINCAAIPEGVAERLLFGAVRGAYSGAVADAQGYIEAADGGVLFLDEIGDLDPAVQAKLLRVLETLEVVPLGASRGRKVSTRFCFATHRNLRAAMGEGRFRADLYYRIARTQVRLAPLRDRREEIPWLVGAELGRQHLPPHPRMIEACLLRSWPGNVRELFAAVRRAADEAQAKGAPLVRPEHLDVAAGCEILPPEETTSDELSSPSPTASAHPNDITREQLATAVAKHRSNLSAAARELGLHRSQLYRLLARHGLGRN